MFFPVGRFFDGLLLKKKSAKCHVTSDVQENNDEGNLPGDYTGTTLFRTYTPVHPPHHTTTAKIMSAIAGSVSLSATSKARGMGFKTSAPMGTRVSSAAAVPVQPKRAQRASLKVVAGNTNEGGLFAPVVILARNIIGVKPFNQIRGKAIALHSQVRARDADLSTPLLSSLPRKTHINVSKWIKLSAQPVVLEWTEKKR